ncbi:MAG: 4-hydroxy-3-methylbut-2-enyl diphosphate reductase [Candidatus Gracilibacteria bacterium]
MILFTVSPHGFCAGVERAILILEKCLKKYGSPIFVNHQIVHNKFLVEHFEAQGVIFEADINKIPENSVVVFSAHGVSPQYREKCENKKIKIIDSTCPLVLKVHTQVENFAKRGYKIVIIGNKNHQETIGTSGITEVSVIENISDILKLDAKKFENAKTICLTQTTLSVDNTSGLVEALKGKIPHLEVATGICYASQNRQNAIKKLAELCDFIVVIGSRNSSNSNSLVETAISCGCKAILLDDPNKIPNEVWNYEKVGLSSGASVPELLFEQVVGKFKSENKNLEIRAIQTVEEHLSFPLPEDLSSIFE